MTSVFYGAIEFMDKLGVYDVILPFLLVYVVMYAFLEKSKVFGTEVYHKDGREIVASRRNLNAMVAFVVAFFVVASTQLVAVINQSLSHMVLLLMLIFSFMLLAGSFHKEDEKGFALSDGWRNALTGIVWVGILLIFFNALGWLEALYDWILYAKDSSAVAALILVLVMAGLIALISRDPNGGDSNPQEND